MAGPNGVILISDPTTGAIRTWDVDDPDFDKDTE